MTNIAVNLEIEFDFSFTHFTGPLILSIERFPYRQFSLPFDLTSSCYSSFYNRHRENGGVIEKRKLLSRTKVRGLQRFIIAHKIN